MKYKTSMLAVTLCLVMNTACAQQLNAQLRQAPSNRTAEKPSMAMKDSAAAKYGVYQLQPDLVAVPQALADRSNTRHDIGNMSLVSRATASNAEPVTDFRRNAVVRNSMTGEIGVVTGNISVLRKAGADMADLLQQFNLKIVRSASSTGIYIVQPNDDVDLLALLQQINASGLVSTARLDILEKKYSNQ